MVVYSLLGFRLYVVTLHHYNRILLISNTIPYRPPKWIDQVLNQDFVCIVFDMSRGGIITIWLQYIYIYIYIYIIFTRINMNQQSTIKKFWSQPIESTELLPSVLLRRCLAFSCQLLKYPAEDVTPWPLALRTTQSYCDPDFQHGECTDFMWIHARDNWNTVIINLSWPQIHTWLTCLTWL